MVTPLLVGALMLGLRLPVAATASPPVEVGSVVPKEAVITDLDGKARPFGELRGRIVFIHFYSIVCPSERAAEPKFIELQKRYADQGVVQIGVDANQNELAEGGAAYANLRDHMAKAGVNFLVAVDPGNKLTDVLGGASTPHCFVIDRDGVLRYSGALDDDPRGSKGSEARAYVRDAIEALLAGKPVAVTATQPYG